MSMHEPFPSDPDSPEAVTPPAAVATTSLGARLVNVFATPTDVFDEVKASPPATANWLMPALLLMLVGWIGSWLVMNQDAIRQQLSDMQEKQYTKLIEQGKMTRQQFEAQRPMIEKVGNISRIVAMAVMPPLTAFALPFWWAFLVWLLGTKVFGGSFSYMKAVEVSGLASMLLVLESVVKTLLMMTFGSLFVGPNLALVSIKEFDPANVTHSLLALVDVMTIWVLVVRSLGLARLSGASLAKSAAWIFVLYFVAMGLFIAGGHALQRAFGGG